MKVELLDLMGDDNAVVDAARVSMHKGADNFTPEQNERLISYLAYNDHWSPFTHAMVKFRIKAPLFVARQLWKSHIGLASQDESVGWNEVSRRYVDDEPEFYVPEVWRKRADNVKQGSSDETSETFMMSAGQDFDGPIKIEESIRDAYGSYIAYGKSIYLDLVSEIGRAHV